MPKAIVRRNIERSVIQMATFDGQRTKRQYLFVKGHVNKASFYQAFTAVELKEAVLDIQDRKDTPEERKKTNSRLEARRIWKG